MFLFTPRARTEGGTAKLASLAFSASPPNSQQGSHQRLQKVPRGWCGVSGYVGGPQMGLGLALRRAGPIGIEGCDPPTGSVAGWPPELA